MASPPHQPMYSSMSQTGTTQTAGARNKGGNFIGQLCISVVPPLDSAWKERCDINNVLFQHILKPTKTYFLP